MHLPRSPKPVARVADLPVGAAAVFSYPQEHDTCILVRVGERDFLAYSNKCSHLSCAVVPEMKSGRLLCPCHHGSPKVFRFLPAVRHESAYLP